MLRAHELTENCLQTIYLGGGTPSILNNNELELLFESIYSVFAIKENAEMTIEVNPEDVSASSVMQWQKYGFNRISL